MSARKPSDTRKAPLKLRRVAIDTYHENVAFLNRNCELYRAEGFQALSKIEISTNGSRIYAVLNVVDDDAIVGLDQESRRWVAAIADIAQLDHVVADKTRLGDRHVRISLPEAEYQNRDIVIVDDVISSGYTVAVTTAQLWEKGARSVHCLVTHALFAKHAEESLNVAGIQHIWSSDSITHSSNVIPLAPLLAGAFKGQ